MRTITFREVWNRVVRLHGRDPMAEIPSDMSRALVEHINQRVRLICLCWIWPEWVITEERAFREVWHDDAQYQRVSTINGQPDEVFYIPTLLYYRVNEDAPGDPPVGDVPDGSDYWVVIDPVDTYIAYDQRCKRAIGMVLGIYSQNPRVPTGSANGLYNFMPSERGVDVLRPGNPTAFITYKMPVPRYTMIPWVAGKNYIRTDLVFDPTVGEVFQALAPTNALPSDTNYWRRVPFPESWANYVAQAAFADSLMEFDQGGNTEFQAKALQAQYANNNADTFLQMEIDAQTVQGQRLTWNFCKTRGPWCESQPWSGGTVSELTDVCDDELGWVYPTPMDVPQVAWQYHNEIVSYYSSSPNVIEIATRNLLAGSIIQWVEGVSGARVRQNAQLLSGAANPLDPGQQNPQDYDALNNNKHWELIG